MIVSRNWVGESSFFDYKQVVVVENIIQAVVKNDSITINHAFDGCGCHRPVINPNPNLYQNLTNG